MSDEPDDDGVPEYDGPSKSQRKRDAHDAQRLGEQLIELKNLDLESFDLPESLFEAIMEARRLTSRHALVRQRQLVGKLMRDVDLDPIRASIAARSEHAARDTKQFKRVEHWRDRLIAEGAPALDELMKWREGMDRADWLSKIAAAAAERENLRKDATETRTGGAASRELFRALRALLDRATIP